MHDFLLLLGFGLVDGMILAVPAVAFTMQFAVTNVVNFAFGAFITFGAFMAFTSDQYLHLGLWQAFLVSGIMAALLSYAVGRFIYAPFFQRRPQVLFALVLTFSTWLIMSNLNLILWGSTPRQLSYLDVDQSPVALGPFTISSNDLVFVLIAIVVMLAVHVLLRYTRLGRSMRAIADDKSLAKVCGINTGRITDVTWLVTGFLAGIAGVIEAMTARSFDTSLGDTYIFLVFGAAILGGVGRAYGAMIGALIIGVASQLAVPIIGSADSPVVVFAILVALMMFRPEGILGATGRVSFSGEA